MRRPHPLFWLCAAMLPAASAEAETVEDHQIWLNATVIGTVGRFAYFAEVQPRFGQDASRLTQLLFRPAVGYVLSKTKTAYAGYTHVVLPIENGRDRNEDRLFAQLNWSLGKVGTGTLTSRSRLERRRLSNGDDTGWRARLLLRYTQPLGPPKGVRALVHAEAFFALNDTDWGQHQGFDQVRGFAGIEVPFAGRSTMDIGYLNQTINDPNRRLRMNHVAAITLWVRP